MTKKDDKTTGEYNGEPETVIAGIHSDTLEALKRFIPGIF